MRTRLAVVYALATLIFSVTVAAQNDDSVRSGTGNWLVDVCHIAAQERAPSDTLAKERYDAYYCLGYVAASC